MKQEIEAALGPLIGEPLSDMFRILGLQILEFGPQRPAKNRKGEDITLSDWGMHVACGWRILGPDGYPLVAASDFGPGQERRDSDARPFYDRLRSAPPVVRAIHASEDGAVRFEMEDGHALEILPTRRRGDDAAGGTERWRFLPKKEGTKDPPHFVVTGAEAAWTPEPRRCRVLFLAADAPVPEVPYDEDAPAFSVLMPQKEMMPAVLRHFSKRCVYDVGAACPCGWGCGFLAADTPDTPPEHAADAETRADSLRRLREMLADLVARDGSVEVYSCPDDDWAAPPRVRRTVPLAHFDGDTLLLAPGEFLTVTASG